MRFVFQNLTTENVVKGKSRYTKAVVEYTYNGEPRKQTMMSFSNPGIFKQVQELTPGQEIDVDVIKNDAGYNEWSRITVGDSAAKGTPTGATSWEKPSQPGVTKVTGSNYETRDERAARQVLIVKQSSLAQAIAYFGTDARAQSVESILEVAQTFADWVFAQDEEDVE
jgi:hypothetical protein